MGSSNGSGASTKSREQQAKQHATRTKKKVDARRAKADGLAGHDRRPGGPVVARGRPSASPG